MKRTHAWWLIAASFLALILVAPFFSAAPLRHRLKRSLEFALSRPVRIEGETHFRLLPSPALLADKVVIGEDTAFSLEPFAYVEKLEVQPSLLGLLSGRFEVSRIRLTEPSVNLMRGANGWNVQSLGTPGLRPPEIEVRQGRLNFKQGDFKSAFYLTNVLLDLSAPSTQGDVKVFFTAEPARTDRGTQGFGNFAIRGQLHVPPGRIPELDLQTELQPSAIHAFNFFFGARGADFAGKLGAKARVQGPWTKARIVGGVQLDGLEPQSFLPFAGNNNRLAFEGSLDLPGQRLALDTVAGETLRARIRARDFFQQPKGALLLDLRQVDAVKLLEFVRAAKAKLPPGIATSGRFNAVVGYSWPSAEEVPAKGMIWFDQTRIDLPNQPSLQIHQANAVVDGSRWLLNSAEILVGDSESATMDASWDARNGQLQVRIATQLLSVKGLKSGLGLMIPAGGLPVLAAAQGGSWQGQLRYNRKEDSDPGLWSGLLNARNISVDLDGIPGPLEISSASILFDPNRVTLRRMRASWDGMEVEGDYSYFPDSAHPSDFNLTISETDASVVDRILHDAQRPPSGLLDRIRLRRSTIPDWLKNRNLSGVLRFKALNFAAGAFQPLVLRLDWRSTQLKAAISSANFSPHDATTSIQIKGRINMVLWQPSPEYKFHGEILNWPLEQSTANFDGDLKLASLGDNWLDSLDGEGTLLLTEPTQLLIKQGHATLEFPEPKRKTLVLASPYWPLTLPLEP